MIQRLFVCLICVLFVLQLTNEQSHQSTVLAATLFPTPFPRSQISVGNIANLKPILKLGQPDVPLWDITWSPSGKQLGVITRNDTAYGGGQVRLFDVGDTSTNNNPLLIDDHESIKCAAFSPNGSTIASCDADGNIQLKSTVTGRTQKKLSLGENFGASSVAFSPDGFSLAVGYWGQGVELWDIRLGKPQKMFKAQLNVIHSVAFSPDGALVAATDSNGHRVLLWNIITGDLQLAFSTANDQGRETKKVMFSPDGKLLIACDDWSGNTFVWDVSTGKQLQFLESAWGVAVSPTDNLIAYTHSRFGDGAIWEPWQIILRNLSTGREQIILHGPTSVIIAMTFNRDGTQLAFAEKDGSIKTIHIDGSHIKTIIQGIHNHIDTLNFSADSKSFVSAGYRDGTVRLWDAFTEKGLGEWTCCDTNVTSVALSPDRRIYAYSKFDGSDDAGVHTIHLVDTQTGRDLASMLQSNDGCSSGYIFNLVFSPDGKILASAGACGDIYLWSLPEGSLIGVLKGHIGAVTRLDFSQNSLILLSVGDDGTIRSWDVTAFKELINFNSPSDTFRNVSNVVAFAPDNNTVASTSQGKTVHLWNVHTGKSLLSWDAETSSVNDLAFSADGRLLMGVSWDYTLKIWDTRTGILVWTINQPGIYATALAFSPDGQTLVTGQSGSILVWAIER